jgi:hypothetical protein
VKKSFTQQTYNSIEGEKSFRREKARPHKKVGSTCAEPTTNKGKNEKNNFLERDLKRV